MRSQNREKSYKYAKPGWKKQMVKTYAMIEKDGQDSAMLQRFPVLRRAKDAGRDIRTQLYSSA